MNKNVGIITWHYYINFGSALQAYALQKSIKDMGCKVKMIDYRNPCFGKVNRVKKCAKMRVKALIRALTGQECDRDSAYYFFQSKYFRKTKLIQDQELLPGICQKLDCVICGSDQIWAPNVFNPVYMLDFVMDNIPKIAYAASVGLNDIPNDLVDTYHSLLSRFHRISVREVVGATLLNQKCSVDATVVLDPTFLIDIEHWKTLERSINYKRKFIFCYFLNANHQYRRSVQKYATDNGVTIIGYSARKNDSEWMNLLSSTIGPCEFLWLIHHAEAVFMDSYHGTIFSLLYHKDFITFERFEASDKICQNSRIYQLSEYFDISNRIIKVAEDLEITISPLDYALFEDRLSALRKLSVEFLVDALEG